KTRDASHHTHLPNWLEDQGRMREGNLPWAEVIDPDPPTYEAFLDLVRVRFRINGIEQIGAPAWEPKLVYTMTNVAQISTDIDAAVAEAIGQLVGVRKWGDVVNVNLPLFYPSGSAVCLSIKSTRFGYSVTDSGLAYRELEQLGADTFFSKNAAILTEDAAVWHNTRELLSEADPSALSSAMADVAALSTRLTWKVLSKVSRKGEAEIADYLFVRLQDVFGSARVEREARIVGPSTRRWTVDALVHLDGRDAAFQAVSNNHMSVYPAAAMFHDLALSDNPPATVAVVKSKDAMGSYFNILAQAGNVIEEAQADQVYERAAVAWQAS
ncbi:hypothetical protein, partial [Sphingobium sp. UBA5915]|uniref:hypothetical protein n=1 Tax=Sphingobium sp. UBA5915 TaxID=1947530 RepID=UPI0025CE5540